MVFLWPLRSLSISFTSPPLHQYVHYITFNLLNVCTLDVQFLWVWPQGELFEMLAMNTFAQIVTYTFKVFWWCYNLEPCKFWSRSPCKVIYCIHIPSLVSPMSPELLPAFNQPQWASALAQTICWGAAVSLCWDTEMINVSPSLWILAHGVL